MSLLNGYATAAESDTFLEDKADWLALDDSFKDNLLSQSRYYIESEIVGDSISDSEVTDEVKYANSLLAYDLGLGNGLYDTDSRGRNITYEKSSAGSVSDAISYSGRKGIFRPANYQLAKVLLRDFITFGIIRA